MAIHWMRLMDNVCFMVNDYRLLLERQSGGHVSIIESPPTALASLLYCCWIALNAHRSPCSLRGCPHVAMGIATLRGHRMTFSHYSKDTLRPLSQGEKVGDSVTQL